MTLSATWSPRKGDTGDDAFSLPDKQVIRMGTLIGPGADPTLDNVNSATHIVQILRDIERRNLAINGSWSGDSSTYPPFKFGIRGSFSLSPHWRPDYLQGEVDALRAQMIADDYPWSEPAPRKGQVVRPSDIFDFRKALECNPPVIECKWYADNYSSGPANKIVYASLFGPSDFKGYFPGENNPITADGLTPMFSTQESLGDTIVYRTGDLSDPDAPLNFLRPTGLPGRMVSNPIIVPGSSPRRLMALFLSGDFFVAISDDLGLTWEDCGVGVMGPFPRAPILTETGRIIVPIFTTDPDPSFPLKFAFAYTDDGGDSWTTVDMGLDHQPVSILVTGNFMAYIESNLYYYVKAYAPSIDGDPDTPVFGFNIYKSSDDGLTWDLNGTPSNSPYFSTSYAGLPITIPFNTPIAMNSTAKLLLHASYCTDFDTSFPSFVAYPEIDGNTLTILGVDSDEILYTYDQATRNVWRSLDGTSFNILCTLPFPIQRMICTDWLRQ